VGAEPENQKWPYDITDRSLSSMERVMEDEDIRKPRYSEVRLDQIDGDLIRRISWRIGYACLNWLKHLIVVTRFALVTRKKTVQWFIISTSP